MSPTRTIQLLTMCLAVSIIHSCSPVNDADPLMDPEINAEGFNKHLGALASDEFLGRGPFSEGEKITVDYLMTEFEKIGLEPGNGDSYYQDGWKFQIDVHEIT